MGKGGLGGDGYLWLIGASLSAIGSISSNIGVNVQKYSFMEDAKKKDKDRRPYFRQPYWVIGLLLVILGSLGDFAALGMTAQSIVAPVGATTLVANTLFAHKVLGESLRRADLVGTVMIVFGCIGAVLSGEHEVKSYTIDDLKKNYTQPLYVGYAVFILCLFFTLYTLIKKRVEPLAHALDAEIQELHDLLPQTDKTTISKDIQRVDKNLFHLEQQYKKWEKFHPFAYCCMSGVFGSQSILFGKMTAELLARTFKGDSQIGNILMWVFVVCMLVTITMQLHWLAMALGQFDAMYVVPVFQCFHISLSTIGGACYFQEFSGFVLWQAVLFPFCFILTLSGVYILSSRQMGTMAKLATDTVDGSSDNLLRDSSHAPYKFKSHYALVQWRDMTNGEAERDGLMYSRRRASSIGMRRPSISYSGDHRKNSIVFAMGDPLGVSRSVPNSKVKIHIKGIKQNPSDPSINGATLSPSTSRSFLKHSPNAKDYDAFSESTKVSDSFLEKKAPGSHHSLGALTAPSDENPQHSTGSPQHSTGSSPHNSPLLVEKQISIPPSNSSRDIGNITTTDYMKPAYQLEGSSIGGGGGGSTSSSRNGSRSSSTSTTPRAKKGGIFGFFGGDSSSRFDTEDLKSRPDSPLLEPMDITSRELTESDEQDVDTDVGIPRNPEHYSNDFAEAAQHSLNLGLPLSFILAHTLMPQAIHRTQVRPAENQRRYSAFGADQIWAPVDPVKEAEEHKMDDEDDGLVDTSITISDAHSSDGKQQEGDEGGEGFALTQAIKSLYQEAIKYKPKLKLPAFLERTVNSTSEFDPLHQQIRRSSSLSQLRSNSLSELAGMGGDFDAESQGSDKSTEWALSRSRGHSFERASSNEFSQAALRQLGWLENRQRGTSASHRRRRANSEPTLPSFSHPLSTGSLDRGLSHRATTYGADLVLAAVKDLESKRRGSYDSFISQASAASDVGNEKNPENRSDSNDDEPEEDLEAPSMISMDKSTYDAEPQEDESEAHSTVASGLETTPVTTPLPNEHQPDAPWTHTTE